MQVFSFDSDLAIDAGDGNYDPLIPLRTVAYLAFETDHAVWAHTNQGLTDAAYERYGDLQSSVGMIHFIQYLIDDGHRVQGVPIEAGWLEVDTIADLEMYEEYLETDGEFGHMSPLR